MRERAHPVWSFRPAKLLATVHRARWRHLAWLTIVVLPLVIGCARPGPVGFYRSERNPDVEFPRRATWAWAAVGEQIGLPVDTVSPQAVHYRIRDAIAEQLERRGYREVGAGAAPAFEVRYVLGTRPRRNGTMPVSAPLEEAYAWGWRVGMDTTARQALITEARGGVIIDLVVPGSDAVAWRGKGEGYAPGSVPTTSRVREVIGRVMRDLPTVR